MPDGSEASEKRRFLGLFGDIGGGGSGGTKVA